MKRGVIQGILIPFCIVCVCCAGKTQESDPMMAQVYKICPKADVINVEHKVESTEIEFLCGKEPVSLVFDKQGTLLYKETAYRPDEAFLRKVQKKVQKTHADWIVDEYSMVHTKDTSFVKLELLKDGVEESMFFTMDGKFYKFKSYVTTESWLAADLKKSKYAASLPYDFLKPTKVIELDEVLKEVSGISVVGDTAVFCVQDELGAVFQVNLEDNAMSSVGRFTDIGDFEDIQVVGDSVVVLRSDGTLFFFNFVNFKGNINQVMMNVPCMNLEGLFYDSKTKKYLVACKEPSVERRASSAKQHKQEMAMKADQGRVVYSFDKNSIAKPEKVLSVKIDEIRTLVNNLYGMKVECFSPSAIAIHPITNETYVLSSQQRMIAVYDGTLLKSVFLLPPEDYYKPEGLDFLSNGDMILCSEGVKKGALQGQIFVLKMKK